MVHCNGLGVAIHWIRVVRLPEAVPVRAWGQPVSRVTIIRTADLFPPESILEHVRRFLFGTFDGWRNDDKKGWRRIWKRLIDLEPGEFAVIEFIIPRNAKFHRKFFSMLNFAFDSWEPKRTRKTYKGKEVAKNFERFRKDVLIMAGFYDQTFDLRGNMKLEAHSISFASMDDAEFEQVYSAVATVILEHVLTGYSGREELDRVVDQMMGYL